MSDEQIQLERNFLACAYLDGAELDAAISSGLSHSAFTHGDTREQFIFLCELRLGNKATSVESVFAEARTAGRLTNLGGAQAIFDAANAQPTTTFAGSFVRALLDSHAKRQALLHLSTAIDAIKSGTATLDAVKASAEKVTEVCTSQQCVHRALPDIADEAIKDAEEQASGKAPTRSLIYTGLPMFDKYATPMETHEYVVVGARTSHGKSSFLTQVVGHNLGLGKKIAVFTLETSDKAVLKQIVGQRAQVNLREFNRELPAKQQEYISKLRFAKTTKNLLIFDKDIQLSAIESRCRMLAASFKPDLVIVDYLGLIQVPGASQYERITQISKAMIPLRKVLGCTLMLGCQLGRGAEKEEREPQRTDFRDSGSIEEDAHRIIALWREPGQALDLDYYNSALLQLKLRDGPLARVACSFHAPTTRFLEQQAA